MRLSAPGRCRARAHVVYACDCVAVLLLLCVAYEAPVTWDCTLSFFFFSSRGRHTRFDCDWSSDVCSSDLSFVARTNESRGRLARIPPRNDSAPPRAYTLAVSKKLIPTSNAFATHASAWSRSTPQIGRASCRERV